MLESPLTERLRLSYTFSPAFVSLWSSSSALAVTQTKTIFDQHQQQHVAFHVSCHQSSHESATKLLVHSTVLQQAVHSDMLMVNF